MPSLLDDILGINQPKTTRLEDTLARLRENLIGRRSEGPPTRFGNVPVEGGAFPQTDPRAQFVSELLQPPTANIGIQQALKLLESQRQAEFAQANSASIQDAVGSLPLDTPESKGLADLFLATGGANQDVGKALLKQFEPFTLGNEATRYTGTGEQIASGSGGGEISQDPVQASSIMPDGTVQIVRRSGTVDVTTPTQANIEKIKSAKRFGAELQGLRAGERGAAKNAQSQALAAFKGVAGVREKIGLFDEALDLLGQGAGTGAIEKIFPSFKAASVALDNVQGRLGLNVIQNTTFGALSEAELKFALSTALPTGLNEVQLSEWITQKRSAMDKLSDYLTNTAIFLSEPGNTIGDYLRQQKTRQFTQGSGVPPTTPLPFAGWQSSPPPGFVEN